MSDYIEIIGAREHNLKNISVNIPRNKLVVITGLSGSGKSSLAFDTIFNEGQRRYIESFSAYARGFIGKMERPDVDQILGLSPVISIEQKTVNKSPRSTVGTITEIYDYLRLLFARVGTAYSYISGEKMVKYSSEQILQLIFEKLANKKVYILSPVVKGRKGHYRELFEKFRKDGFLRARINGEITELKPGMQVDRYKIHDIDLFIDKVSIIPENLTRISKSLNLALKQGNNSLIVVEVNEQLEMVHEFFYSKMLMCPTSGISYDEPAPNSFSFNSPYGACSHCSGLGEVSEIDESKIFPDKNLTIKKGGIAPLGEYKNNWVFKQIEAIGKKYGFDVNTKISDIPTSVIQILLNGSDESFVVNNSTIGVSYSQHIQFPGIVNVLLKQYEESNTPSLMKWAEAFMNKIDCPECKGSRLKKESLYFKVDEKNISEVASFDILNFKKWIDNLPEKLSSREMLIAKEILVEINNRTKFLLDVGLSYLTLNRSSATLSGGEAQRIRLATQIGSKLTNVLYILDEPSIGLHQRDNHKLIQSLKKLRDIGNSVIVVEHDKDIMLSSDYIIDIGPKAGKHGGKIVAQGEPLDFIESKTSTARYIKGDLNIEFNHNKRTKNNHTIKIHKASGNNLKNVTVEFPLGKLICVTGVSGSGKSSLVNGTLYPILSHYVYNSKTKPLPYQKIEGLEYIDKVIEVDQSPIGRTPRSNPATYTGLFADIRALFSNLPEAKIRGYKPGRFSFNVKEGRCDDCLGAGVKTIEMNFLPDVYVPCETCSGKRYSRETLQIRYKAKSIGDVLDMTIEEATSFFENIPSIYNKLNTLMSVGLGYIQLGQSSVTLSGGEAQRVKLATELAKKSTGKTVYIMDEPSTGLHFEDIDILLKVIYRLVDQGNTVIIIEHNLDIIKVSDYIIDMGPEGGNEGGNIIATGSIDDIIKNKKSYTGHFLKLELKK